MPPTPGGTIHETEHATTGGARVGDEFGGHTGTGYLKAHAEDSFIEWRFDVPRDGTHQLEFRYALASGPHSCAVEVNGVKWRDLVLWQTGGPATWGDRLPGTLRLGRNAVRLAPKGRPLVDHVNVIRADGD